MQQASGRVKTQTKEQLIQTVDCRSLMKNNYDCVHAVLTRINNYLYKSNLYNYSICGLSDLHIIELNNDFKDRAHA